MESQLIIIEFVKNGHLEKLQLLHPNNIEILQQRDSEGHFLTHYAALFGRLEVLMWLVEHKVPLKEPSLNEAGHYPIHWACINNHVTVINYILSAGESLEIRDSTGATPLIVAAKYGHIASVSFLMSRGAHLEAVDYTGDSALHWAASRGSSDLCRVLIYSGLSPHLLDHYGQSVLRMAVNSRDLKTVKDLLLCDHVNIHQPDQMGQSPLNKARERNHLEMVQLLLSASKGKNPNFILSFFSQRPVVFVMQLLPICFGYPMYIFKGIPLLFEPLLELNVLFVFLNMAVWICFYHAQSRNPGYLPRNTRHYDRVLRSLCEGKTPPERGGMVALSRLCHSCKTVKPLRASHCRECDRCVYHFDHHCVVIGNCVGLYNRHTFFLFIVFAFLLNLLCFVLVFYAWSVEAWIGYWYYPAGIVCLLLFLLLIVYSGFGACSNALNNLTTMECAHWERYEHFNRNGHFVNPFSRGVILNLLTYLHCISRTGLEESTSHVKDV